MKKLNLLQRIAAFVIDGTVALFCFQTVALLISYFYFLPFFPGYWGIWVAYYIVAYRCFGSTLGEAFFKGEMVSDDCRIPTLVRIVLREVLTSLPGLMFWLTCGNQLSIKRTLIMVLLFIILRCFRKRVSGIKILRSGDKATSADKPAYIRKLCVVYLSVILIGCGARIINTVVTNDIKNITEAPLDVVPRPTGNSVREYADFLKDKRQDINDYILGLFENYDHVILCERHHQEMTQYDMIYDLVTDSRFVDKVGVVFTEIGCAESRDDYKDFLYTSFSDDSLVEKGLASFLTDNQSVHLLWPNTNWFNFLKRMYYFNHGKENKVEILFADRNWIDRGLLHARDSIMADNIISTVETDSIGKSLIIMNYRHSYLTPGNCGYYVDRKFPGKVANVMINFAKTDIISLLSGEEATEPLQNGRWDVAFEQMPDDEFAFDFKDSPFGSDDFDHFVLPWSMERGKKYQDMFTGMIYYKAPEKQYTSIGFSHLFDPENITRLKEREQLMPGYSLEYWYFLKDGEQITEGKEIYHKVAHKTNVLFWGICLFSLLLDGLIYVCWMLKSYSVRKITP